MSSISPRPDHAVINVLYEMDAAVERFRSLGFTVTPRGYHSLGSINHLMVFGNDYLELVGVQRGADPIRREVAESPPGLNGLVFRTFDATECHAALQERGIAAEPPLAFSRPVTIDGREELARFRTVRLKPGAVNGGRVYFCEHLTPQLVWRPEWQSHRNGVDAIREFTIVVRDPESEAASYARMLDAPALRVHADEYTVAAQWLTIRFTSHANHRRRFGELAAPVPERDSYMAALVLHTRSIPSLRACAEGVGAESSTGSVIVPASQAFGAVIEFVG